MEHRERDLEASPKRFAANEQWVSLVSVSKRLGQRAWLTGIVLVLLGACASPERADAGTVRVRLEAATSALRIFDPEVDVRLSPGAAWDTWTPDSPALFQGLQPGQSFDVVLPGRFLSPARTIEPSTTGAVDTTVPVIPIDAAEYTFGEERVVLGHALWLDTTFSKDRWLLTWRSGDMVTHRTEIPAGSSGLQPVLMAEWKARGMHHAPKDRNPEDAVVIVPDDAGYDDVLRSAEPFSQLERTFRSEAFDGTEWRPHEERRCGFRLHVIRASRARTPPRPPSQVTPWAGPRLGLHVTLTVSGPRAEAPVRDALAQIEPELLRCYHASLADSPERQGSIAVRFVVDLIGGVHHIGNAGSDLPDARAVQCVQRSFGDLRLEGVTQGLTTVVARMHFSPQRKP